MVQSHNRPVAGLMVVAAASVGLVGFLPPTPTAGALRTSRPAVARAWFHDPVSAAARRGEIPVPADPAGYTGAVRQTAATFRTHGGSVAVPVGWAIGHTIVASEAVALTKHGLFAFNQPTLTAVAAVEIGRLRGPLARVQRVRCEGYTDFGGPAAHQQALSLRRARAVCALVQRDHPGMTTYSVGYGGNDPVVVGGTPAERAQNRRVVLVATVSTPAPTRPGSPRLSMVAAGDGTAEATFSAPTRNGGTKITGYQLSTDAARTWHPVHPAATGPGPYTVTIEGLTDGTTYPVTVEARNSVGLGPSSNRLDVTPTPALTVPGAPVITAGTPDYSAGPAYAYAYLTFTDPTSDGGSPLTGYQVSEDGGTTWTAITYAAGTPDTAQIEVVDDACSFPTYTFTLEAINGQGPGPASNAFEVDFGEPDGPLHVAVPVPADC